jgi:hypothetical protein
MLAACFLSFVFAAAEAEARGLGRGGGGGGRAASAPRSLQRAPVMINRPTQGLNVTRSHRRPFHHHARHHHARRRLPFMFVAPYVTGDDFVVPPIAFAQNGGVPPGAPVIINRRQCFVQPHIVPAEATGAMRTVTVTRCY